LASDPNVFGQSAPLNRHNCSRWLQLCRGPAAVVKSRKRQSEEKRLDSGIPRQYSIVLTVLRSTEF
jgi:hypothetical protein